MKTGLKLATLGLVASLVALIWLGQINRTLASHNLALTRKNAELRTELKLATQRAEQIGRDVVDLDTQLGATKTTLTDRQRREASLLAELATLRATAQSPAALDQSAEHQRRITELENQLTALLARALAEPATEPVTPQPPAVEVVRLAPDESFVILNGGTQHGLGVGQILPLVRGTTEVARVQISDARPLHAVAQVLSDPQKGKLQMGDRVLLTP